mgnify:CR=1 FL=1
MLLLLVSAYLHKYNEFGRDDCKKDFLLLFPLILVGCFFCVIILLIIPRQQVVTL